MASKFKSSILAGAYVAIGAIVYLAIPNNIIASCFFAVGILLVLNYHNMLFTKVVPSYFSKIEFGFYDIFISLIGNFIGAVLIGIIISTTRLYSNFLDHLNTIVNTKINDNYLSLFAMAVFCGILVAYSTLTSKKYPKGSIAQIFYTWLFITAFVLCGFDHIVANFFYFSAYFMKNPFTWSIIPLLGIVTIGNFVGGMIIGILEKTK